MEKLHGADPVVRAMERENRELREELRKRVEQQSIMEQIVGNVSSLLDGASEAMCIFDKEGYFLHMNNACRRMMGMIDNQHPTSMSIFDAYLPRDRDRVVREFFTKKVTNKWNGMVTFFNKHTGYESTVMQTIEALSMSKHSTETAFFKSFFTPQSQELNEKIRMFSDMITHMPHGVGMWRLERGHTTPAVLRLACANKIANQYVGVPLLPGSLIHEVIPGGPGIEVHRFLEDVVRTQRVISLDSFRIGAHSFSVTAYPLYPDFVVVIMDPPKGISSPSSSSPTPSAPVIKEPTDLSAFVSASGLAVAACDATHVVHANDNMTSMLSVPPSYLKGRDFLSVLETRTRSSSRSSIDQFRRAMRDRVVHHVEVELENYAWKMSCHPMGEGGRHLLVIAYRTRNLAPQVQAHSQRPMFPILPSSFASSSSSSPFSEPSKTFTDSVYKDTIDFIPCGIVILKSEDIDVRSQFKVISVNHAAKGLSIAKGLSPGHRFDDSTSPFDPSFMRSMHMATKSHEGRIAVAGEKQTARIVPLHDASHIAIMFEEIGLFDIPHIFDSPRNGSSSSTSKRAISDLVDAVDRSYHTLPNSHSSQPSKYMRKQDNTNTPSDVFLPFSNKSTSLPILPPLQPQSFSSSSYNQQPLSARSDKMDKIVQNCTMAIVCIDPSGGITMANKTFGQMLGYSESDLSFPPSPPNLQTPSSNHLQIVDVVHQDDVSEARGAVRQIVCGEITNLDLPLRFIHKVTRNIVWGVASFMAIEKGVVMQIQQPTRLKNFPEVLLSDKDVLRTAFSEMVVGTAVLNVEKTPKIVSSNGGFCAIMAGKENDLAGRALVDLLHAGDRDAVISVALDAAHAQNASDAGNAVRAHRSQLLSVRTQPLSGPARYGALSLSAVLDSNSRPFLLIAQLQLVDKPFSS